MNGAVIEVNGLSVAYRHGTGWSRVVDDVSFSVAKGEVFGLVGESGCGKSTVALQLLGYRHPSLRVEAGNIVFDGTDLVGLPRVQLDRLRGRRISYVPQNPTTALNPGIRVGAQVAEILQAHGVAQAGRVAELFDLVGLPDHAAFVSRYPHQLSGGQQQRVCIAMALACDPDLVVLDEPTTGLDVTTQEQIVSLLVSLRARLGMSMLYVTHDLALLAQIADRVGVMYAGRMVEVAPTAALFEAARHPYTQGLIGSIPQIEDASSARPKPLRGLLRREELPPGCPFSPRCEHVRDACMANVQVLEPAGAGHMVACWRWRDIGMAMEERKLRVSALVSASSLLSAKGVSVAYGKGARRFVAVRDASFTIGEGETLALVGESGSGKSTLARAVSGLMPPASGAIRLDGAPLAGTVKARTPEQRRRIQFIFQNPDASLNPRARVGTTLARPVELFFPGEAGNASDLVAEALDGVRLDRRFSARYPDQLSGGERQRVAIARALIARPSLLLCDEVLSALDVSVQANILALLQRLKMERGIAMLFISHDLAVVREVADRVCVLFGGDIVEEGARDQIFAAPFHPYTYSLLQAVPNPRKRRTPKPPRKAITATASREGCVYAGRCAWKAGPQCDTTRPPWRETAVGLRIRCHLGLDELTTRAGAAPEREPAFS